MTFTIGRASFTNGPTALNHSGDRLSVSIDISPATTSGSVAHAKALRQQLLGLMSNPDEPVVPVTWSDDADFDGFYKVGSVSVDPFVRYLANGFMRCQVDLERVAGGYAAPRAEAPFVVAIRTNSVGVAAGYSGQEPTQLVYPSDVFGVIGSGDLTLTVPAFTTPVGSLAGYSSDPTSGVLQLGILPGSWYKGGCLLEVYDGTTWRPVIGRQMPNPTTSLWRISNGIVRAQFTGGTLVVEYGAGSASWETLPAVTTNVSTASKTAIIRNGPDDVTVECAGATSGRSWRLSVRRAAPFVEMAPRFDGNAASADDEMKLSTPAAVTAITDSAVDGSGTAQIGFYSGADANGNRVVVCSPTNGAGTTLTVTTGTGILTWSGGTAATRNAPIWLVGGYGDASPTTYYDTFGMVAKAMFTAVAHTTRIVAR